MESQKISCNQMILFAKCRSGQHHPAAAAAAGAAAHLGQLCTPPHLPLSSSPRVYTS